jgi:hypothetical protein
VEAMLTKSTAFWSDVQQNFADGIGESFTRPAKLDRAVM